MNKTRVLKVTAEERRLIAELTCGPVFDRLDAGELEIVDPSDWSDVPDLEWPRALTVPPELYRKLKAASRKRHTTPDRLACSLLAKELRSA